MNLHLTTNLTSQRAGRSARNRPCHFIVDVNRSVLSSVCFRRHVKIDSGNRVSIHPHSSSVSRGTSLIVEPFVYVQSGVSVAEH